MIIYRRRSVVFEYLVEPKKLRSWMGDLVSATPMSEISVGAPYVQTIRTMWRQVSLQGRVEEFVQDEQFTFLLEASTVRRKVTFRLSSSDNDAGTYLMITEERTPLTRLARLALSWQQRGALRKWNQDLLRLKKYLDRGGDKP